MHGMEENCKIDVKDYHRVNLYKRKPLNEKSELFFSGLVTLLNYIFFLSEELCTFEVEI